MDKRGNGWNCVVGRNFGGHVIHQTKKYIFFQVKELSILLWKSWSLFNFIFYLCVFIVWVWRKNCRKLIGNVGFGVASFMERGKLYGFGWSYMKLYEEFIDLNRVDHFFFGAAFFWAFWAALSWAFWAFCFYLFTVFLSPCFFAILAFFLSLISLIAYSARAFLSSALAFLSLLIVSRVIPSIALFYSLLSSLFLLALPTSVCFIFLWSLLHAVAHLNLWALIFLN